MQFLTTKIVRVKQVCIFAYGQTGSGKTHTMLGNPDIPGEGGVIPRSLEQVFQSSQSLSAHGWSFRMQVCNFLQIRPSPNLIPFASNAT